MAEYNRGGLPKGILPAEEELNYFLEAEASAPRESAIPPAVSDENR
jgi:hypothetical protein